MICSSGAIYAQNSLKYIHSSIPYMSSIIFSILSYLLPIVLFYFQIVAYFDIHMQMKTNFRLSIENNNFIYQMYPLKE